MTSFLLMSGEALTFECPVCGERLQDVFWDGDNWLWATEDEFIPCFLDDQGTLAAFLLGEGPYDPVRIVNVHCHYFRKSSFLLWLAIIAAVVVVVIGEGR